MIADKRQHQLQAWLENTTQWKQYHIEIASADASFRRYFRITHQGNTYIAMDAPPEKENSHPFIDVSQRLREINLNVPTIHHYDLKQGFMLLDDFGDSLYLSALNSNNVNAYYSEALQALHLMQKANTEGLPQYDRLMLQTEMQLMPRWFLQQHLALSLTDEQMVQLNSVFDFILDDLTQQPQCFVHRDFHSRNLMITKHNNPGIIDHQDAVLGPITYDLISLVRDCYITWPNEQVYQWIEMFRANHSLISSRIDQHTFAKMADMSSLQRHIKVLGIFCRLYHRDNKPGYLKHLTTVLNYIMFISTRYKETQYLSDLFAKLNIKETVHNKQPSLRGII